jgi:hypothetical protein
MKTVNLGDELIMRAVSQRITQRIEYGKAPLTAGPPSERTDFGNSTGQHGERESDGHRTRW